MRIAIQKRYPRLFAMILFSSLLILLLLMMMGFQRSASRKIMWGSIEITPASVQWYAEKVGTEIIATNSVTNEKLVVFKDIAEKEVTEREDGTFHFHYQGYSFQIVSLAGPILSVRKDSYRECTHLMHPYYRSEIIAVNLDIGGKEIAITDLFPEDIVLHALLKNKTVKQALQNEPVPRNLDELAAIADGGCKMSFDGLQHAFSFHDCKQGTVIVRFGLTHGCEAMGGNLTPIDIIVPLPPAAEHCSILAEKNGNSGGLEDYSPNIGTLD